MRTLRQLVALHRHYFPQIRRIPRWMLRSREYTNFTYDYTDLGMSATADVLALLTGVPHEAVIAYSSELSQDTDLRTGLERDLAAGPYARTADPRIRYGRRLVYYLLVRSMRPRFVVEAGTDKGLGACLIARALQRNAAEGQPGTLVALDTNRSSGAMLGARFMDVARLCICDSVEYLYRCEQPIDLFIHDTTPDAVHERSQYAALARAVSPRGVLMSSWYTPEFLSLCRRTHRRLLVLPEFPLDHWYPGSRLPIAFPWPGP
jgi:hypothetical protein